MREYVEFREEYLQDVRDLGADCRVLVAYQEEWEEEESPEAWVVFLEATDHVHTDLIVIWEFFPDECGDEWRAGVQARVAAQEFAAAHGGLEVVVDDWRTHD